MMNGGMSVILLHAIYCSIRGFAGISIAWCKVQLYPLHFMAKKKKKKKKKEVGWSHWRKRVIRAHTNGVFSPRNPDSRFITLPRRAGGAVAPLYLFIYYFLYYYYLL